MSGKYIGLKFYFAGSISGGRDDTGVYLRIVKELKKYGKVLTEHVADPSLLQTGKTNLCTNKTGQTLTCGI